MCSLSAFTSQDPTPAKVQVSCAGPPGDYKGTITATAGTNSITVPVSIHIAPGAYHGLTTPPVIGSVVNAASNLSDSVAPGEIVTIHGIGVGSAGVRVLFDGVPAPALYTSLFQTNLTVPMEVSNRRSTSIQIESNGTRSDAIALPVSATTPAIFSINSSGIGQGSVLNSDNSVNGPANPAQRGSVIQIYATGGGQAVSARASIGGVDAPVMYAGPAPRATTGLYQVNAVVPQSVELGDDVPLMLKIGEAFTQPGITIAVH